MGRKQAGCLLNYTVKLQEPVLWRELGLLLRVRSRSQKLAFYSFIAGFQKPSLRAVGQPIAWLISGIQEQILRAEFRPID